MPTIANDGSRPEMRAAKLTAVIPRCSERAPHPLFRGTPSSCLRKSARLHRLRCREPGGTVMIRIVLVVFALAWAAGADAQEHQGHGTSGAVTLFPAREVSGTAWQPDLTPMYGFHGDVGGWTFMVHAHVFAQYLYESSDVHRTSRQAGSINWFMGMLRRPAGRGRVSASTVTPPWPASRRWGRPAFLTGRRRFRTPSRRSLITGSTPRTLPSASSRAALESRSVGVQRP